MLTLRCTRAVRARLHLPENLPLPQASSGVLGDWYVHLVRFGHVQLILATSERSLLTVLLPARDLRKNLSHNIRTAVAALLEALDVSPESARREIAAMEPVAFGRAENRRVLGSMNDFAFQARIHLAGGEGDLLAVALRLAETPMSAIGLRSGDLGYPDKLARELLASHVV
ncbi:MAG: DUF6933 domain-containing protein [Steroidobacteraceae bacterium]